jgi:hypothetical protein
MLKVLSFLMVTLIPSFVYADTAKIDRGSWRPFTPEFVFEGTVVESDKDLTFWIEPDARFIDTVRKKADEMSTAYVVRKPLLLRIKLAAVETGSETGIALSEDDFDTQAQSQIRSALLSRNFQFRCYGNYADFVVPFCSAIDIQGKSIAVALIERGLVKQEDGFLGITPLEYNLMVDAQKKAQDQELGMWKPFRMMLRGLK